MIHRKLIGLTSVVIFGASVSFANEVTPKTEPLVLTAAQLDTVTAGVGANNRGVAPWDALQRRFSLNHNNNSDPGADASASLDGVAVPSAVPNSFCFAFCP